MRMRVPFAAAFLLAGLACAQDPGIESAGELAARIEKGGWFESSKWQRGADGALQMYFFADSGMAEHAHYLSLLGDDLERGMESGGLIGWLSLVCHGSGDLLGMTDAEFHFGALGIDTSDVGLRQYLAVPAPSFDGSRGRAELLDRLLAIDVLTRRDCKSSLAELRVLQAKASMPTLLRDGAARAIRQLEGQPATGRTRLTAAELLLPAAFDVVIEIDHSHLPDLSWLTATGRRIGALVTAREVRMAGGTVSPATSNGAQSLCDICSELPFGVVHKFGNARLDHSCFVISMKADPRLPVAFTWQATGEFEAERWQQASAPAAMVANNPLLGGALQVTAKSAFASSDKSAGKTRPAMVEKLGLLCDDGSAIRVILPQNSKAWPALSFLNLPPVLGGEVRILLGEPATIVVRLNARDEEGAEDLVAAAKSMLLELPEQFQSTLSTVLSSSPELKAAVGDLAAARVAAEGRQVTVAAQIRGVTVAKIQSVLELLGKE